MIRCQLCGYEFDETQASACSSCALNPHCAVICCPNCGYQSVDESKSKLTQGLRQALLRAWGRRRTGSPAGVVCRLSELPAGQSATVVAIESNSPARQERLNVFGVMPGCQLVLEQSQPTFVVRIGFTELSLEREIADEILIERAG